MLSDIRITISEQGLENRDFSPQMGSADYQNVTTIGLCQESREGLFALQ